MRPLLPGDLIAAARVLLAVPEAERPVAIRRMIAEAEIADRYRKRLGRGHRLYGNGSLMAAAMRRQLLPEPFLGDPDYLDCLATVIRALSERHGARPVFSSCRSFRMKASAYLV